MSLATHQTPVVSVVIPTRGRPDLVPRAVTSALNQTFVDLEVIAVVDGPDPQTIEVLGRVSDERLRVIQLDESVGGSEARNVGARAARGNWIALLDDDDEWLPEKIAKQLRAVQNVIGPHVLVTTQYIESLTEGRLIRPRKFPKADEAISEYLYCSGSWLGAIEGFPQTSTWLLSRTFLLDAPFTKGLRALQDIDWLLRALADNKGCEIRLVPEPLSIFHNEKKQDRITTNMKWRHSYEWAMGNQSLFSRRALAFFLVICCVNPAARNRESKRVLFSLLKDCFRHGEVTIKLLWLFTLYTLFVPYISYIASRERQKRMLYFLTGALRQARQSSH